MQAQFLGVAGEVTGSCHLLQVGSHRMLLDCGLIQGGRKDEAGTEIKGVFNDALTNSMGNTLTPAFAVGRTQEILYLFAKFYEEWGLNRWRICLDSPLAIEATEAYARNSELFDDKSLQMWWNHRERSLLPNLRFSRSVSEYLQERLGLAARVARPGEAMDLEDDSKVY